MEKTDINTDPAWMMGCENCHKKNEEIGVLKNTLKSDEISMKKLVKRNEELRDDLIKTAWQRDAQQAEITALQARITHCDNCGGSWYDDGLTGRCLICRIKELTEALEKIRLWCEGSTCEICGEKEMKDTDCYDYVKAAIGGQDAK